MQENIPIEEVFESLRCSRDGLTTQAAEERLSIFGHNKLEEKKVHSHMQRSFCLVIFPELLNCEILSFLMNRAVCVWFRRANF